MEIPFLQAVCKNFTLVPIVMGEQSPSYAEILANAIYDSIKNDKRNIVIIASSDLSHYHPYAEAVTLDNNTIEDILSLDENKLWRDLVDKKAEMCGYGPVMTAMILAKKLGYNKPVLLKYANSGDTAGNKDRVVGYAAIAFAR